MGFEMNLGMASEGPEKMDVKNVLEGIKDKSAPDTDPETAQEKPLEEIKKSGRSGFLKKIALSGALMMGAAAGTGCDSKESKTEKSASGQGTRQTDNSRVEQKPAGRLMSEYEIQLQKRVELGKKIIQNQRNIIDGKIDFSNNEFLQTYYKAIERSYIEDDREDALTEGQQMRVLQIALKKGFVIPKNGAVIRFNITTQRYVPVHAEINGQAINISRADLTPSEIMSLDGNQTRQNPTASERAPSRQNGAGSKNSVQGNNYDNPRDW